MTSPDPIGGQLGHLPVEPDEFARMVAATLYPPEGGGFWRVLILVTIAVLALAAIYPVAGCARVFGDGPLSDVLGIGTRRPAPPTSEPANPLWWLGWMGFACAAFGIVTLLASTFLPLVPRKTSMLALGLAVGCGVAQWFFDRYLWAVALAGVVAALAVAYPWAKAWFMANVYRHGKRLAEHDPRAGVALMATARGWTNPGSDPRRLALLEMAAGPPHTGGD